MCVEVPTHTYHYLVNAYVKHRLMYIRMYLVNGLFVELSEVHKGMCGLTKFSIWRPNTEHLCTTSLQQPLHSRQTSFINNKDHLNTYDIEE